MQILPIINQPNFYGKVIFHKGRSNDSFTSIPKDLDTQFKNIATLVQDKKYNIYISPNRQDNTFFNVAANTSFKKAKKIKEYTVKIRSDIMNQALTDAAKDAIGMYEKYISKGIKG